jgi:hypothetical protein
MELSRRRFLRAQPRPSPPLARRRSLLLDRRLGLQLRALGQRTNHLVIA